MSDAQRYTKAVSNASAYAKPNTATDAQRYTKAVSNASAYAKPNTATDAECDALANRDADTNSFAG